MSLSITVSSVGYYRKSITATCIKLRHLLGLGLFFCWHQRFLYQEFFAACHITGNLEWHLPWGGLLSPASEAFRFHLGTKVNVCSRPKRLISATHTRGGFNTPACRLVTHLSISVGRFRSTLCLFLLSNLFSITSLLLFLILSTAVHNQFRRADRLNVPCGEFSVGFHFINGCLWINELLFSGLNPDTPLDEVLN